MAHPNKIALIGFMASGKSSVSPLVASHLGYNLVDLDALILERSGYTSIAAIFEERGEIGFRDLESSAAGSLRSAQSTVVSTGGGIIGRPENISALKENDGVCVLLDASFVELVRRVPDTSGRPLLHDRAKAEALYNQRQPLYRRYADLIVDTEGKSISEVCREVVTRLGEVV